MSSPHAGGAPVFPFTALVGQEQMKLALVLNAINPKWIESVKRHGYKGAFELAATIDYLFGYDATAQIVDDWMYERATQAYVQDPEMQRFFEEKNPWALRGISERLLEAADRGLWAAPDPETIARLRSTYLELEGDLEGAS